MLSIEPRLRNGAKVLNLIRGLETTFAVLKDQVDLMMLEAEYIANGVARGEVSNLRKQWRPRELGLRLRAGDSQAARSMLQRQRALKAVQKMRAAGFPNLKAARAAKAAKAAGRRAK
jgi:hypothetical protein